jgi:hypothetical protein
VLIRLELAGPGVQYIADNQLYNSIITAHAILMIFFMVNKQVFMLNSDAASYDFQASSHDVLIDNNNNNNDENKSPLNNSPARPELLPSGVLRFFLCFAFIVPSPSGVLGS